MPARLATLARLSASIAVLASAHTAQAKEAAEEEEENQTKTAFPTLDILPEGSILQRVRLPRYDKDFNPNSLLTADKLRVLTRQRIDGENVTIELYDKQGKVEAHVEMGHAIYNQKSSTLHATEAITLKGNRYQASGKGLIFHWHANRGFLIGPASSQFVTNTPDTSSAMKLRPKHPSITLAGALLTLTTSLIAEPPEKLTPAQLSELDQLTQPSGSIIENARKTTEQDLAEEDKINRAADAVMKPFLQNIGQGAILITATTTATTTANTTEANKEPQEAALPKQPIITQKKPKDPKAVEAPKLLRVECDGGIYFDTDTGILAYLKNIRLTEPRFKMSCSDELKVFLDKKTDKKPNKKTDSKTGKTEKLEKKAPLVKTHKKEPKKTNEDELANSFGDLKRIVAIGKVRVVRKDEKGQTYIATAETASYNAKTGDMILRGNKPRIQVGPHQFIQSESPGKYIKIEKTGKFIIEGKATTVIETAQPKQTPNK